MSADEGGASTEDLIGLPAGDRLIARAKAKDEDRVARADPIYPGLGDRPLESVEAADLATAFRALRDARRGDVVAPRSRLPGTPELVADALMMEALERMADLEGRDLRAAQREFAEVFVDLQSFRPDDEAARLQPDPTGALTELDSLLTARAAVIAMIREDDMSVTGNRNALRGLDVRIGDGRIALDAVDRYRERQALGLLTMIGIPIVVVVVIAVIVLIQLVRPAF